jgi:hypothetical protein
MNTVPTGSGSGSATLDTESCYSTFDCELLASQAAMEHFRHFCGGRAFKLWIDHKLLVTAVSHVSVPISP